MSKKEKFSLVSKYTGVPITKLKEMQKDAFELILRALVKSGKVKLS